MTRDSKSKTVSKKEFSKKMKKQDEVSRRRKSHEQSDDDSDDDYITSDDENEEMDVHEYRKLLQKIFPSKFMDKKVKSGEEIKKLLSKLPKDDDDYDDDESEEDDESSECETRSKLKNKKIASKKYKKTKIVKKSKTNSKKSKKVVEESSSDDDDEDSEDDDDDDDEETEDRKSSKFNIIFTIGKNADDEDESEWEDDDDWEDDDEIDYTEDEDESVSTDEDTEDEDDDDDEESEEDDEESDFDEKTIKNERRITRSSSKKQNKGKSDKSENKSNDENIKLTIEDTKSSSKKNDNSLENDEEVLKQMKELFEKNKDNKILEQSIKDFEDRIKEKSKKKDKKLKKQKQKNSRIFKRIISDKNSMNDYKFFETLTHGEQIKIIKEIREINKITRVEVPHRMSLLEAKIPPIFKAHAMKKLNSLRYMEPGSGEYYKIKNWVDTFMRIPFNKYENLPINISDGVEACHEFMAKAQETLDSAVYGLNDAKMQIMQMLGQLVTNPSALGTAIAIKGPMGTGKTTLVKEGISKILNRPFAFVALGGATDSSFLEGHSYTYEGSIWGKIVQIIIDSGCMNPVIYFDELDKISDTPKGEEIAGILTHLTDTSQNSQFHDKYFAEIDFDLSKCLFIFSYNDESKVNPILRDRMYRIQTKGYDKKQKTVISNNYLLPRIREQVKFSTEDIVIPEESVHHIIEKHCEKEDGVRNLKRCLEIIYTKLNLYRLMRPGSNLFEDEMSIAVEFPFTVTKEIVDKLIKKERDDNMALRGMYV
uniref:ATPase AAA-type core domain-containing protein n=1 Tax=viral metagenome TaxID=1070528 RepID=A0A6C0D8E0_9ZZZZ